MLYERLQVLTRRLEELERENKLQKKSMKKMMMKLTEMNKMMMKKRMKFKPELNHMNNNKIYIH